MGANSQKSERSGKISNSSMERCKLLLRKYCEKHHYRINPIEIMADKSETYMIGNPPSEYRVFTINFYRNYPNSREEGEIVFTASEIADDEFDMLNKFLSGVDF